MLVNAANGLLLRAPSPERSRGVTEATCQVISTSALEIRGRVTQPITVITMPGDINAQKADRSRLL